MIDKNIRLSKGDKPNHKKITIHEDELEKLGTDHKKIKNENDKLNKENTKPNEKLKTIETSLKVILKHEKNLTRS